MFLTVIHMTEKLCTCVFLGYIKNPPVQNQPSQIREPLANQIRVRGNSDSDKKKRQKKYKAN